MSSTEEESFIILDESPSLLEPYSLLQMPKSIEHNSLSCASIRTVDLMDDTDNSRIGVGKPIDEQPVLAEMSASRFSMAASQTKESISPNLAESFLLGAIDRNTMMNSVSIHFPSLVNSATKPEDIERLQGLMQEHTELKENLERSNVTMRQQFSLVNSWLDNVKGLKEKHQAELNALKCANSELNDVNKKLKMQLDELRLNMDAQAQLDDKVATGKTNESDIEANKRCAELEALVQNLQIELSNAIAEKLEYEDTKKTYIDEIDCVQVNLVATEELYKATKAESMELKAANATLKQELDGLRSAMAILQEQMNVVKAQSEVYETDFKLERNARQEIAGEKEQILADLQLLQRRNQILLDRSADDAIATAASQEQPISISSSIESEPADEDAAMFYTYTCPVCNTTYANVDNLYRHVNECLEKLQ